MTWELRRLLQPLVFLNDQMNAVLVGYTSEEIPSKFVFSITDTTQACSIIPAAGTNTALTPEGKEARGGTHGNTHVVGFLPQMCVWAHALLLWGF